MSQCFKRNRIGFVNEGELPSGKPSNDRLCLLGGKNQPGQAKDWSLMIEIPNVDEFSTKIIMSGGSIFCSRLCGTLEAG